MAFKTPGYLQRLMAVAFLLLEIGPASAQEMSKEDIADTRASIIVMNAIIDADPNDACLYFERGLYHKKLGNYQAASRDFKAVDLLGYPYYKLELYSVKGFCDSMNHDWYKAVEDYNFALRVYNRADYLYANRAEAFLRIKRYKLALLDCLQAIKLDSHPGAAFSTAGEAYYRTGQYKYAVDYLNKAIQRNAGDARAFYFRGLALRKLGQKFPGDLDIGRARALGMKSSP